MLDWKKLRQNTEKIGYKTVTTKTFMMPDKTEADYTTWGKEDQNVAVIALDADNQVVVARQFRPGPEKIFDELPGGGVDVGEDLEAAARRELLEETGYISHGPLEYIGRACRDAYTNEINHYFLAKACESNQAQQLDDGEFVEIAHISIDQLIENAKTFKMSDSVAILLAYDRLQQIKGGRDGKN